MFICRQTRSDTNPNGRRIILEATHDAIDLFLQSVAKVDSRASKDAALMALANGHGVRGINDGALWYRVEKPATFVPAPTHCDLSQRTLTDVMYDGRVNNSARWATMDEQSWQLYGCGILGTGNGQKYQRGLDGLFYVSEGMASVRRFGVTA